MQKRAITYKTFFHPLPVDGNAPVYFDKTCITLPCNEDFPMLHYHDRYEIGFCSEGNGLFLSDGQFFSVSAGDMILISPGIAHYSRSISLDGACKCRFAYVKPEPVENIISSFGIDPSEVNRSFSDCFRSADNSKENIALREIIDSCKRDDMRSTGLVIAKFVSFLLEYGSQIDIDGSSLLPANLADPTIQNVAEYIALHYNNSFSSSDLASICHLSESQLRRRFAAAYGNSPMAYRNSLRCRIAAELISRTGLSLSEVSSRVGYSSVSDFYRAFVKYKGTSPSEYRRRKRADQRIIVR